jgi:hypothetical protein
MRNQAGRKVGRLRKTIPVSEQTLQQTLQDRGTAGEYNPKGPTAPLPVAKLAPPVNRSSPLARPYRALIAAKRRTIAITASSFAAFCILIVLTAYFWPRTTVDQPSRGPTVAPMVLLQQKADKLRKGQLVKLEEEIEKRRKQSDREKAERRQTARKEREREEESARV